MIGTFRCFFFTICLLRKIKWQHSLQHYATYLPLSSSYMRVEMHKPTPQKYLFWNMIDNSFPCQYINGELPQRKTITYYYLSQNKCILRHSINHRIHHLVALMASPCDGRLQKQGMWSRREIEDKG